MNWAILIQLFIIQPSIQSFDIYAIGSDIPGIFDATGTRWYELREVHKIGLARNNINRGTFDLANAKCTRPSPNILVSPLCDSYVNTTQQDVGGSRQELSNKNITLFIDRENFIDG